MDIGNTGREIIVGSRFVMYAPKHHSEKSVFDGMVGSHDAQRNICHKDGFG